MSEKVIFYARVSTHSTEQVESLKNQIEALTEFMKKKNYPNSVLVKEITSISNGMSDKLKCIISGESDKVNIVVMNFDRLIRDFTDLKFLRENVKHIIAVNEKKNINLETEWKELLQYITASVDEIDKLKLRLNQYNGFKKRERTPEEQVFSSKKRCCTLEAIVGGGKFDEIVNDVSKMIQKTQDLTCKNDWKYVSNIAEEYGQTTFNKDYKNVMTKQSNGEEVRYALTRNDVNGYVRKIFDYLHIKIDDFILKEYVNANVTLGRKLVKYGDFSDFEKIFDVKDQEQFDENLDDIIHILKKISVNILDGILSPEEIGKIKKMTEGMEHSNETAPKKKKSKKM
jgi:predicted site-specific integrase-resolvase